MVVPSSDLTLDWWCTHIFLHSRTPHLASKKPSNLEKALVVRPRSSTQRLVLVAPMREKLYAAEKWHFWCSLPSICSRWSGRWSHWRVCVFVSSSVWQHHQLLLHGPHVHGEKLQLVLLLLLPKTVRTASHAAALILTAFSWPWMKTLLTLTGLLSSKSTLCTRQLRLLSDDIVVYYYMRIRALPASR